MSIDSHMHIYDPSRPQGVPWPDRDDEVLYRMVLPSHCKEASAPHGVTGMVVVEASEWVEDNQWVLDLAEKDPFIVGVVGNLEPGNGAFARDVARLSRNKLFRGIRLRGPVVDKMTDPAVVADLALLVGKDLELDVLVQPRHLPATAELAERLPYLRIVINHVAGVLIDGSAPDSAWVEGMTRAAQHPNMFCKVSGLASATRKIPAPTEPGFYVPTLDVLWNEFGEDRLIYGSDWPVCSRYAGYGNVVQVVAEYFRGKGDAAAEKYFLRNGRAAYKWLDRSGLA